MPVRIALFANCVPLLPSPDIRLMASMETIIIDNGRISYIDSLKQQTELFENKVSEKRLGDLSPDYLIFNEHNPVVTLGQHAHAYNILFPEAELKAAGVDVFAINRGGDVTYHGPGQWTVYPIFDLEEMGIGIKEYVHRLEQVAIDTMSAFGLEAGRISGASGVWTHIDTDFPRKVCAIGIKASRYITMHGIAFNVTTAPEDFHWINPCGFTDKGVTSLSIEAGREVSMSEAKEALIQTFTSIFELDSRRK